MKKVKTWLAVILKIAVTLLVISPFYIAVVYSVKSKPELVTNRLAWPKEIHWENFTNAIETSNFGLALKNSFFTTVISVVVITIICTMAAYIIARKNNRFYNRNLLGGLYRENPVKSRNYEAVKSSKKWENVGNSYIIPALLLYRYSYI